MKRFKRRTWILLGTLAIVAIVAAGAYAWLTAPGTGTGHASVATPEGITIVSDPVTVTGLWPGVPAPVDLYVSNPNSGKIWVATIHGVATAASVSGDGPNCAVNIDDLAVNTEVNPGTSYVGKTWVTLPDVDANQNGCGPYNIAWSTP